MNFEDKYTSYSFSNGILFAKVKQEMTEEGVDNCITYLTQVHSENEKIRMLIDPTASAKLSKNLRSRVSHEFGEYVKALAVIDSSPLIPLIHKLMTVVDMPPFPIRIFRSPNEALKWLRSQP